MYGERRERRIEMWAGCGWYLRVELEAGGE